MRVRRWILPALVVLLAPLYAGCSVVAGVRPQTETVTPVPPVKASTDVVAEGRIVPKEYAQVSFGAPGEVAEILVQEGDTVTAGQPLIRLNATQAQAAVAEAEGALQAAQAQLAELKGGPQAEQIAAAEAAVDAARSTEQSAEGTLAGAQANLAQLQAGPTEEQVAIAQHQVEAAKNALWGLQAQRDGICGNAQAGAQCDQAQGAVQQAEEQVRIAELQLQQVQKGATDEQIAAAEGQVQQALGQLQGAQAGVAQAQAALDQLQKGATDEQIAAAEAQVAQAQGALERAQATLADMELRAPIAGQVAAVDARLGERVQPGVPVVQMGDLSGWRVETDDLTEMEIVRVAEGQKVSIVPDALPDLTLAGTVEAIDDAYQVKLGDVTYDARIRLDETDPRLRWGMTVSITFES